MASREIYIYKKDLNEEIISNFRKRHYISDLEDIPKSKLCFYFHPQYCYKNIVVNKIISPVEINGALNKNSGFIVPNHGYLTKINNILPYINIATEIDGTKGSIVLNMALKLILEYFKSYSNDTDRKSLRLNSSHSGELRMPSSA